MQKDKSIIELIKLWDVYCKFTNKEICKKNTNLYIINHYFLNPVKPTYSSLKILKDLQNLSIKKRLVYRIKFYYDLFKFLFIKINLSRNQYQKNTNKVLHKKYDYLIITHLNNKERFNTLSDPYYGKFIDILIKNNKKILLVFIPHISLNKSNIKKIKKINNLYDVYFLSPNYSEKLNIKKQVNLIFNARKKLLKKTRNLKGFLKNLYIYSAESIISKDNQKSLNYANAIYNLVKINNPKNIISTYEGHSWERSFFYFSKSASKNIRCIGYQHTLLFKYSHSIYREISDLYNPDLILASGKITAGILNKKLSNKIKIKLLGSHKKKIINAPKINKNNSIIFLPSGEFEEAFYMTNFAINYAKFNPKINIIIRYHPIIKNRFNKIRDFINFKKSSTNIIDDCKNSRWAIYSSSTAIFEAIECGCLPINIYGNNLISVNDPLWQINSDLINRINSEEGLSLVLKKTSPKKISEELINEKYKVLINKINDLSSKYNKKLLLKDFN